MEQHGISGSSGARATRDELDQRRATRGYLIARSLAGPASAAYAVRSPAELPAAFWIVFAAAHLTGIAAVALAYSRHWRRLRPEFTLPGDIAVLTALLALSGGAQSELRNAILAMMIAPAIVMTPRVVTLTGATILVGYLGVALPDLIDHEPGAPSAVTSYVLGITWATGTAAVLSSVRTAIGERVEALLAGRRVLLGAVLDSEARERRRITRDLHEGALQFLLAARQDIEEARAGEPAALGRAEVGVIASIDQLRDTIAGVHPVALDHGGLAAALRAIADRAAFHGAFEAAVTVDPVAEGVRDDLLVNVARELIGNAADHAGAQRLDVRVEARDGGVVLEVADDGVGFDPLSTGPGAVGLAACAERVASADGTFEVDAREGEGTLVRVALPAPAGPGGDGHL